MFTLLKFIVAMILAALAGLNAAHADVVLGLEPQLALKLVYPTLKGHKALAIGPGGIWVVVDRQSSADLARKRVVRDCDRYVKGRGWAKFGKCVPVAIDGSLPNEKGPVWPSLDDSLPLPDRPFEKARVFAPDSGKAEGIVLAIHGAENAFTVSRGPESGFYQSWIQYLNSIGMMIVYPSAWDDTIQMYDYAGWNSPAEYPRATAMNLLRIAQIKRTISQLQQKYPGLPIYLWSHSAGGIIAQSISEGISGVIVVGTSCGVGSPVLNAIPNEVPALYIYGDHDEYVVQGKSRLTLKALKERCGKQYATPKRRLLIAKDEGHQTSIWHQDILNALADFFRRPHFDLASRGDAASLTPAAQTAYEKRYRFVPTKKAFAVGKTTFAWSESQKTQDRADFQALFKCNKAETGFSYPPSGRHTCRIYARGDRVLDAK